MSAKSKRTGKKEPRAVAMTAQPLTAVLLSCSAPLLADLRELILSARQGVARAIDSGLVTLYWQIDRRIRQDILQEKRVEYGKEIVSALRRQLAWTHFKSLIYLDDPLKQGFYTEICRLEHREGES